jgi:hypothetical protein
LGFEASPGKKFMRLYLEKIHHKKRDGGVAQGVGLEFKSSTEGEKKRTSQA